MPKGEKAEDNFDVRNVEGTVDWERAKIRALKAGALEANKITEQQEANPEVPASPPFTAVPADTGSSEEI